jgi:hypothetical protein
MCLKQISLLIAILSNQKIFELAALQRNCESAAQLTEIVLRDQALEALRKALEMLQALRTLFCDS